MNYSTCILLLAAIFTNVLPAQIRQVDGNAFSNRAVRVVFEHLLDGTNAKTAFAASGVIFEGVDGGTPIIRHRFLPVLPPSLDAAVVNESITGDSSGKALALRFLRPVRRLRMRIDEGTINPAGGHAEVSFYGLKGLPLGVEDVTLPSIFDFLGIGFETSHPDGIWEVVIDYGENETPEQLAALVLDFDFDKSPNFDIGVSQIASGLFDGRELNTNLWLLGSRDSSEVEVNFYRPDGQRASLMVDGQPTMKLTVELSTSPRVLQLRPLNEEHFVGHAVVRSRTMVEAHAEFVTLNGPPTISDNTMRLPTRVLVPGVPLQYRYQFSVEKDFEKINTGIAISNPISEAANLRISLRIAPEYLPSNGDPIRRPAELSLGPNTQVNFLVDEFCRLSEAVGTPALCEEDQLSDSRFSGVVVIAADQPISVSAVILEGGVPVSSIPMLTLSQLSPAPGF